MPKTKEREVEKPSAKSTRTSAKASSAKTVVKSSSRVAVAAPPAKPAPSAKLTPPAKTSTSSKQAAVVKATAKSSAKLAPVSSKLTATKAESKPVKVVAVYKCPFSKDELGKWRQQLMARRNEISLDIAGLEKDAMEAEDGHTTPNHIAERGSDADLQDVSLGIAGEEKDIIWQIDRALRKIDKSSPMPFGLCEFTKEPISRNRLQLIPWTPLSIEGANHMEQNHLEVEDLLADE